MKTLLFGSLFILTTIAHTNACSVTLKTTSARATTGRIGEVTFGKKQIAALKSLGCKVSLSPMNERELMELAKIQYESKLKRIQKTAKK